MADPKKKVRKDDQTEHHKPHQSDIIGHIDNIDMEEPKSKVRKVGQTEQHNVSKTMEGIFGPNLISKSGEVPTTTALAGKVTGIYFSAHWCGPCRGFTPVLSHIYDGLKQSGKPFEIVFVSSDHNERSFNEYFGEMPWLALPFKDRDREVELNKKYKVKGIPTLVLIDENGQLITLDGRSAISNDPKGDNFPWIPKTIYELLEGELRKNDGSVVPSSFIQGKNIALYFSAHWCPPCRLFTPKLAELYKAMKANRQNDDFEFIFVSSDRDETSFNEYHKDQPWLALPFSKRKEMEELSTLFKVEGIPTLVTLNTQGVVINKNAQSDASEDPTGVSFPWKPKPMEDLSKTVECNGFDINEKTSIILLCDGVTDELKQHCFESLMAVATELSMDIEPEEPEFLFFIASEHAGPVPQVKKLIGLQEEELVSNPVIVILDIPAKGGFYMDTPVSITTDNIKDTLNKYKTNVLTRSQL